MYGIPMPMKIVDCSGSAEDRRKIVKLSSKEVSGGNAEQKVGEGSGVNIPSIVIGGPDGQSVL